MLTSRAIVAVEPGDDYTPGSNWELQDIVVPTDLRDGEVLVEMVASGICHTDLSHTSCTRGIKLPFVPGHEGSAIVKFVGPNVSIDVKSGDPVLLSFDSCGTCWRCMREQPSYCKSFVPLNMMGRERLLSEDGKTPLQAQYFGQSSFAKLSIVKESSIVPAKDLLRDNEELKLFAPLGCGIQTGAGAILNLVKPGPDDRVLVTGLGGVGMSAVMVRTVLAAPYCSHLIRTRLQRSLGANRLWHLTG